MTSRLKIRLHGTHVADLEQTPRSGKLSIRYAKSWLDSAASYALSLRMPLREEAYGDAIAGPFVAGLLPDSKLHRRMIGQTLGLGDPSEFGLLEAIGRECAGAVSVVPEDEDDAPELSIQPEFEVLAEAELAELIRNLPRRPLMINEDGHARLSLAGVNDKAALIRSAKRLGRPLGDTPSTHILKTDTPNLVDSARTENFCLKLAREMGIKAPRSYIEQAEDQVYLLVSRYDRKLIPYQAGPRLQRIHQEDFCSALGFSPDFKYEHQGGPDWKACFRLLDVAAANKEIARHRSLSARPRSLDRPALLTLAMFQWFIGNPDAHAKNYSLLLGPGGASLAPAYDLNNSAAFRDYFKQVRPRMAMSIGGEFHPDHLTGAHWEDFAVQAGFPPAVVRQALQDAADRLPDIASTLANSLRGSIEWSERIDLVVADIAQRCAGVPQMLAGRPANTNTTIDDVETTLPEDPFK
jgi:serine/threonine-protein kinase HipA